PATRQPQLGDRGPRGGLRRPRRHGHALGYCYYDDGLRRRSVNKWLTKAEGAACRATSTSYRSGGENPVRREVTCKPHHKQSAVSARCRRTSFGKLSSPLLGQSREQPR